MSWDFTNIPWEPFTIVGLIFVCLALLGYSWRQGEVIHQLKMRIEMQSRELSDYRWKQISYGSGKVNVSSNGRNGD